MTLQESKNKDALKQAEHFLRQCVHDGLAHSYDTVTASWVKPYPEVTGYILSYFARYHPREAEQWCLSANTLVALQHHSGGFPSFYDPEYLYAFDTGQIMHGLLSLYLLSKEQKYLDSAVKAGTFLESMQVAPGIMFPLFNTHNGTKVVHQAVANGSNWGSTFSYIQVKNTEGLRLLTQVTRNKKYDQIAFSLGTFEAKRVDYRYTHPLGYYLEGLWALGKQAEVKRILTQKVIPHVETNGFIPYFPGASYAYVSGSIQLGILLVKTGNVRVARRIFAWAKKVQSHHSSGGLFQYAQPSGAPDGTIHLEINSWGTKYFAELLRLVN